MHKLICVGPLLGMEVSLPARTMDHGLLQGLSHTQTRLSLFAGTAQPVLTMGAEPGSWPSTCQAGVTRETNAIPICTDGPHMRSPDTWGFITKGTNLKRTGQRVQCGLKGQIWARVALSDKLRPPRIHS